MRTHRWLAVEKWSPCWLRILFLILTSHGSRDGLDVVAGRLAETLKPSQLSEMLGRTGVRNKVVIISACYSCIFIPRLPFANGQIALMIAETREIDNARL